MTEANLASQLRQVAARVAEVVVDLPPERLRARPGEGEWSAIKVVGHLIDKFDRWGGRAERVLSEEGPQRGDMTRTIGSGRGTIKRRTLTCC